MKEERELFSYSSETTDYLSAVEMDQDISSLLPHEFLQEKEPELPRICEQDVVRHFTNLSHLNFSVDNGFYPLGSCTMKYNPKVNEHLANLEGFSCVHPLVEEEMAQGALQVLYELEECLKKVSGFSAFTLQPAAGAHGETTGILLIKAYHNFYHPQEKRTIVLVPDTAHGTNPATAALAGFAVREVKSDARGNIDIEDLRRNLSKEVAGLMLTNPNTLGLFEQNILEVSALVHSAGALLYGDGANFNALLGIVKPAGLGFDLMHFNLHKTFATPHGGGGPGAGAVGVIKEISQFLPAPLVRKKRKKYFWDWHRPHSIGRVRSFYSNFLVGVKAYAYFLLLGEEGVRKIGTQAVLNANYLLHKLKDFYGWPYQRVCMHEFVIVPKSSWPVSTIDIAKRIIDYGYHPPTVYFPLIVHEAIMIEPTETESKQTLDEFSQTMKKIAEEAQNQPELLKAAPVYSPVTRVDEARANRQLVLRVKSKEGKMREKIMI